MKLQERETKGIVKRDNNLIIDVEKSYVTEEPVPEYKPKSYRDGGEGFIKWVNDYIRIAVNDSGSTVAKWKYMNETSLDVHPETGKSYRMMWWTQQNICREALRMENGRFLHNNIVFCWSRGDGKCFSQGSQVLMHDGNIKKVEDIKVGDFLMGPDSKPRKVLSLVNGEEEMFEVIPRRGQSMTITGDHKLTLKRRKRCVTRDGKPYHDPHAGKIFDITLNEFVKQSKTFKERNLLFRVPVEFPEKEVDIDPYFLGLWLGDGDATTPAITTMDKEVVSFIEDYAAKLDLRVRVAIKKGSKANGYFITGKERRGPQHTNTLLKLLQSHNLIKNKHIPLDYKANSREVRLQVLAGLVDSDGNVNRNSIEIIQKNKKLTDDIAFLARSLGFHANVKEVTKTIKSTGFSGQYYRIGISGDCSVIPARISRRQAPKRSDWKDVLVTGIKEVKSVGVQKYYGFTLDGDHRFLMDDFTVTHNSLLACLIQLWKFFCFPRQLIVLGANSKDQSTFVHYDIIKNFILSSPKLLQLLGSERNIQNKEIKLTDSKGNTQSSIRAISSFSGIVSNITGYTFSEIFDMKNPKFYVQLDGSIRNIPNALGVIDSTVSAKDHVLYKLYQSALLGKTQSVYYSYRYSRTGNPDDYMNPQMTLKQLNDYREKFPFGEFERYFLNTWEAGHEKIFSPESIAAMNIVGIDGKLMSKELVNKKCPVNVKIQEVLSAKQTMLDTAKDQKLKKNTDKISEISAKVEQIDNRMIHLAEYVQSEEGMIKRQGLEALSDLFDTNWAITSGIDFGDPYAVKGQARTVMTCTAKGVIGSRTYYTEAVNAVSPRYIYILLALRKIDSHSVNEVQEHLEKWMIEYDGIDKVCSERYGAWDTDQWCKDRQIEFEPIYPNYSKQKEAFKELYDVMYNGRFKSLPIIVSGSKSSEILVEELGTFDHDLEKKKFASSEKFEKGGVQDDAIYALGWDLFGARTIGVKDFRVRKGVTDFGSFVQNKDILGSY